MFESKILGRVHQPENCARVRSIRVVIVAATVAGVAALVLAAAPPLWLRAVAAFALAIVTPGIMLTWLVLGESDAAPAPLEWAVYPPAFGFAFLTILLLGSSYLPGGLSPERVRMDIAVLSLLLALFVVIQGLSASQARAGALPRKTPLADFRQTHHQWLTVAVGLFALIVVAGVLRFTNLGYAEFHGDESRAVLRAAAVIQGYENVLFIHRKTPGEILVTVNTFAYGDQVNEASARVPFALANLAGLIGVFLLGWRLRSKAMGYAALFLLVFDGYLVAFSRFVQYQSVVFLLSVAAVIVFHRIYRAPDGVRRLLPTGALFLATALLFHWDGALAFLPAGVLLAATFFEGRLPWARLWRAALPALVVGAAALGLFFIPYLLQPNAEAAASYLIESRLVGETPGLPNNLVDIFARTSVYSSVYYQATLALLSAFALLLAWKRGWNRTAALAAGVALSLLLAATLWRADWLTVGGRDFTILPYLLLFGGVWIAPRLANDERALWLWFGAPFVASLFLIAAPRSHVHIFFVPWALAAGLAVDWAWRRLHRAMGARRALVTAFAAAALGGLLFGGWIYLAFMDARTEMVLNWREAKPALYWTPEASNTIDAKYGFPLRNGWKTVGSLYAGGNMGGDYDVLLWADYISWWYLRDQWRCFSTSDWYFTVRGLEPWAEPPENAYDRIAAQGFSTWGDVQVNGRPGMRIFAADGQPAPQPSLLNVANFEAAFDAAADPYLNLNYPAVEPPPPIALHTNFDNKVTLEGYALDFDTPLQAGDSITLTLYWRGQVPLEHSYKVSNQMYDANGNFAAQKDSVPVCDRRFTNRWRPGEAIVDRHSIPIQPNALPGVYPLYTTLYREETGERLPVLDANGAVVDDKVMITELTISPP